MDSDSLPAGTDLQELAEIIGAFNQTTTALKESHDALQGRVSELSGELSRKNQELEETLSEVSALKNYLANILESITDGVLAIDLDRRVVALNQAAAEAIPGLTAEPEGEFVLSILPESCRELGVLLIRSLSEERRFTNVEIQFKDADSVVRTLSVSVSPIRSEAGAILGAVQSFRDLTVIKALEAQARQQQSLAALGEMAAGVAHEIRNPLGGIELYASNLRRHFDDGSREHATCEKIIAASTSLNKIVTDMLTFTRRRELVRKNVTVEKVVRLALDLAAAQVDEKKHRIELQLPQEQVLVDADLLGQACLNVILNAAQMMPEKGVLQISAVVEKDHERDASILNLHFADDGPGIPEDALDKIFNPFFTLRKEGTGLGLAIVHKIVEDHGGTVMMQRNEPKGTIVSFRIPIRESIS